MGAIVVADRTRRTSRTSSSTTIRRRRSMRPSKKRKRIRDVGRHRGACIHLSRLHGRADIARAAGRGPSETLSLISPIRPGRPMASCVTRFTSGCGTTSRRQMSGGKPRVFDRAQILSSAEEMSPMRPMDRIGGRILTFIGAGCWPLRIPVGFSKHNLLNICVNCHPIVSYSVL